MTDPLDDLGIRRLRALGRALAEATEPAACRDLVRRIRDLDDASPPGTAPPAAAPVPAPAPSGPSAPPADPDAIRVGSAQLARLARRHTVGALVTTLTHELSQPLSAIGMYSNAAAHLVQTRGVDAAELAGVLRQIETQVKRAGDLLGGVRAFTRQDPTPTAIADLSQCVDDALALLRPLAAAKQVQVLWEAPAEPVWVAADRTRLAQVLLNLLCNGVEAIEGAGSRTRLVSVSIHPEPGAVLLRVCDTGPGISPAAGESVFAGLASDKPTGCGLGLAISRALIAPQGGRLWADTAVPAGAALNLRLALPPDVCADPCAGASASQLA